MVMSSLVAYGRQGELPLLTPLTWEGSQLAGCGGLARADSCYIVSDRLNAPQGTFHDCRILHAMVHIIIMQLSFRTDMEICHKSTVKVKACYISSSYYFRFCIIVTATNPKKMLVMVCKRKMCWNLTFLYAANLHLFMLNSTFYVVIALCLWVCLGTKNTQLG